MKNTISYQKELDFFIKTLEYSKISCFKVPGIHLTAGDVDLGVRKDLGLTNDFTHLKKIIEQETTKKCVNYITDEFFCHYVLLILPKTTPEEVIIIGPYLLANDSDKISAFLKESDITSAWLSILKNYYFKLPCLTSEDALNAILYSFADCIWGKENYSIEHFTNSISESTLAIATPPDSKYRLDTLSKIDLIDNFYAQENALLHAISNGQVARAKTLLSNLPLLDFKNEIEPLQNLRVFSIAMNTLFRKAAEQGGVHPIYIHQVSNTFIEHIDTFSRTDNIIDLWNDMIKKYCTLVNSHSTRNYSLLIQKVIIQINLDLSADLSLKTMSEYLNVNASYLSNLFHKETGYTLTNYVNKKRMDYAAWMLSSTELPISTIAQHCGILDDNYFTKLFKKQFATTPTQFRNLSSKHDLSK